MSPSLLSPTTALFMDHAPVVEGAAVLLAHSDDPALARWLVQASGDLGRVTALHTSYSALSRLARVPGLVVSEDVYPDHHRVGTVDVALIDLPKGRILTRASLWTIAQAVRPGGVLVLAGPNAGGAKSAIKDAEALLDAVAVLGYKGGARVALATRPDALSLPPDWADPAPWQPQMRLIRRPQGDLHIVTQPGVFSWDHLDDGTALLLDHLGVAPDTDVLDVGCGYGVIGLAAAQLGSRVVMVDDDLLAVRCARASVAANNLGALCTVLPSDVLSAVPDHRFDLILSNPPFHQGIDVSTGVAARLIRDARDHLRPGGRLRLVANRFLAYGRLMQDAFGSVVTVADNGRYHVLDSVRSE